ncbi:MAG: cation transporter [Gemmatimonadetes bacterium]|nr:cation transporter [Gemmatimonadota bacterium]
MSLASDAARVRTTQIRRVLWGILVANLAVVAAKFAIGLATHSLAVLGDAVHSATDALNNVLALGVIRVAAREPDEDHPYGHNKFETLGALAIVVFLSISGFELVKGAVDRLLTGTQPLAVTGLQLAVLAGTLAINSVVALYETGRGRALDSDLLLADAGHTRADVLITIGVLAGVLLSRAGYPVADPIAALLVTGAIVWIATGIVRRSVPVLVDQHAVPAAAIRAAAERVSGVHSAYHIRSRGAPHLRFAEVTIAVDGGAAVKDAHRIADAVESRLREELDLHEVVVHVEPVESC